ncbi:hypothetical protein BU24DRAFT_425332 [Aaosphaeria arxii CBS 175.79]|uniref:Uncharacterized protein n=1 Tax=Aaosphaeria arxii CBS 175.79 TaxID=1450172 RepID=A0A6A5XIK3_9PLEO|nr:uncharacterized protein BU24DRAFT_425332 [Aaosphaeria arxii CBS 175.79]KAF2012699.1 hypothetical protein BU24DRAFT_425332 [Aaosphaeria arxii CBS 175.79]
MSKPKPTYFLTPPRPYPPEGPIRLGAIIQSHNVPDEPLFTPGIPKISDVTSFNERNWTGSHVSKSSTRFGIWTSFLEMILSVGVDVGIQVDRNLRQHWQAQNMCTMSFVPSRSFIEESVASEEVMSYVVNNRFTSKIYMITGVMIASCSTAFRESLEESGVYIHAGVDASAWTGIPVSAGPEAEIKRREFVRESSIRDEDYVFAFRIREIKISRKGTVKSDKPFDKGAKFGYGDEKVDVGTGETIEVDNDLLDEDGENFGLAAQECITETDDGDEEECVCVMPELDGF